MKERLNDLKVTGVRGSDKNNAPLGRDHRPHYTVRRRDPKLSAPAHDVDWWRAPQPRKSLFHRFLSLFKL
ncbi:hypothetical protein ACLS0R_16305 [Comamonas jiangduensis]|uniref:hypothetical protein n=1 Tax=Comamonas jiangduensis TaxID=1194168 RepID=UPI003BF91496